MRRITTCNNILLSEIQYMTSRNKLEGAILNMSYKNVRIFFSKLGKRKCY